jgi:hypothetical protein
MRSTATGAPFRRALLPALVLLVAALLRTWQLGLVPPGFQFDEAHNAIDAARWLDGQRPLFLPDNGGREVLLTWLHASVLAALGRDHVVLAMRLVSACAGLLTVALTGVVIGRILEDRRLGWWAAAFLAISPWHLHFSRYAIRAILAPLWATGAVGAWWMATRGERASTDQGPRRIPWWAWAALCGVCLAGAVWSHPSGRLLPLVLVGHLAWRAWLRRSAGAGESQKAARAPIQGAEHRKPAEPRGRLGKLAALGRSIPRDLRALGLAGAVSALLFAPLGLYFWRHPWLFVSHASDVSLAAVAERDFGGSLLRAAWAQLTAVAGMFFVAGDPSTIHGLPDLPVYDPLSALAALVGAGVLLGLLRRGRRPAREVAGLLLLWGAVGLLPTLLSDRPPNFSRAIAALPVLVALPALGLRVATRWPRWGRGGAQGNGNESGDEHGYGNGPARYLPAITLAFAGAWALYQMFIVFPRLPHLAESYDQDKVTMITALDALPTDAERFLAPVWAEQATIDYLVNYRRPLLPRGEVWDLNESDSWTDEEWQAWAEAGDDGATVSGAVVEEGDTDGRVGEPSLRALDWRRTLVLPGDGRDVLLAWPAAAAAQEGVLSGLDRTLGGLAPWPEIADKVAAGDTLLLPSDDVARVCGRDGRGGGELRSIDGVVQAGPISALPGLQSSKGSELACLHEADDTGELQARLLVVGIEARMAGDMAPPRDAPLEPETFVAARFGGAIELVGYTVGRPVPGEALPVTLVWRVIEPLAEDLTTFVHLQSPDGRALGQEDREPGFASYPTSRWRSGELIIDRFEPRLDPAAAEEEAVRPVVGWYARESGERLRVAEADALPLRTLPVGGEKRDETRAGERSGDAP